MIACGLRLRWGIYSFEHTTFGFFALSPPSPRVSMFLFVSQYDNNYQIAIRKTSWNFLLMVGVSTAPVVLKVK